MGRVRFPLKGSLSEDQLEQLKTQLQQLKFMSAAQHFALSKKKQEKNRVFKPDWKAFGMWKDEAKRREKQRVKNSSTLKPEKNIENSTPNTLYPVFLRL